MNNFWMSQFLTLLSFLAVCSLVICDSDDDDKPMIGMIYPWAAAQEQTVKKLDLDRLDGKWYTVYDKNSDKECEHVEFRKTQPNTTEVSKVVNGEVKERITLEQNKYLEGKLSRVVQPEGQTWSMEFPWWVLHANDSVLVIYRVEGEKNDSWSIHSRSKQVSQEEFEAGKNKLQQAGAKADANNEILYSVSHHCD